MLKVPLNSNQSIISLSIPVTVATILCRSYRDTVRVTITVHHYGFDTCGFCSNYLGQVKFYDDDDIACILLSINKRILYCMNVYVRGWTTVIELVR